MIGSTWKFVPQKEDKGKLCHLSEVDSGKYITIRLYDLLAQLNRDMGQQVSFRENERLIPAFYPGRVLLKAHSNIG